MYFSWAGENMLCSSFAWSSLHLFSFPFWDSRRVILMPKEGFGRELWRNESIWLVGIRSVSGQVGGMWIRNLVSKKLPLVQKLLRVTLGYLLSMAQSNTKQIQPPAFLPITRSSSFLKDSCLFSLLLILKVGNERAFIFRRMIGWGFAPYHWLFQDCQSILL